MVDQPELSGFKEAIAVLDEMAIQLNRLYLNGLLEMRLL